MKTQATTAPVILEQRQLSICRKEGPGIAPTCDQHSVAGAVSQRACVYCGARVVLNPITDAFHLVHGPIGCASYTWDIRGSLSSGSELYRNSFSTDLGETDVIFGGEKRLVAAIDEIVSQYRPKVIFVYATCIVGVIGDDVKAVCKAAESRHQIRIVAVMAPGFAGHKAIGYRLACEAILELIRPHTIRPEAHHQRRGINILGDFNLAGEMWIIRNLLQDLGIPVVAGLTGDASYAEIIRSPQAVLNVVQCAGSMTYLAKQMEEEHDIPWVKISFFGIADTASSLLTIAQALGDPGLIRRTEALVAREINDLTTFLEPFKQRLNGKKAAIYVGGGFKAISLIRQFRELGMETVLVGTQTGKPEEYAVINSLAAPGTIILDDTNPAELEAFILETGADILVGGVKERPLAYKLGVAFCDHNHERKHPLAGFAGVRHFAAEVDESISSPVWSYVGGTAV